jgi:hypothetical protein
MKRVKLIATALALMVLAVLSNRATAQQANTMERTFLTFSGAVEMPGVTLEPGTYVFKLADTPSRNVVQVWDKDEKNMMGHWTFVQAERPQVSEDTVVMFKETREGATPAVQFWYFPGEKVGKEFIYPKDQAEKIATRTGAKVRTDSGYVEGGGLASIQPSSNEVAAAPSPEPADNALRDAPAPAQPTAAAGSLAGNRQPAAEPEPLPEPKAEVAEAAPAAPAPAAAPPVEESRVAANQAASAPRPVGTSGQAQRTNEELPRTASPLALSGLLGLFSLAGAAGIRVFRA